MGGVAEDLLRSAGQTAKNAGGRAVLTFSQGVNATPEMGVRPLAESLVKWLVEEQLGEAELQQQKPSTVELTELGEHSSQYVVQFDEPGLMGRSFRFVFRAEIPKVGGERTSSA